MKQPFVQLARYTLLVAKNSATWRKHIRPYFAVGLLPAAVALAYGCPGGEVASDTFYRWDLDGDTMSNAVEGESHNRDLYLLDSLHFNLNPSRPFGTRGGGSIISALNLPDTGYGFKHDTVGDHPNTDDWGTLPLINVIEQVGRRFRRWPCRTRYFNADSLARVQPLDLSRQGGGYFSPHAEHQNGLDVDVRYVRHNNEEGSLNLADPVQRGSEYDSGATKELFVCFIQINTVIRILYDSIYTRITNAELRTTILLHDPDREHANHFHVRVQNPGGGND